MKKCPHRRSKKTELIGSTLLDRQTGSQLMGLTERAHMEGRRRGYEGNSWEVSFFGHDREIGPSNWLRESKEEKGGTLGQLSTKNRPMCGESKERGEGARWPANAELGRDYQVLMHGPP